MKIDNNNTFDNNGHGNDFIADVSNLLPCPFCGGKVEEEKVQWNISQAKCTECDKNWGTCGSKYDGRFDKWNVRAR